MNLEEARDWARVSREQVSSIYGLYEDDVIVALDDRITELEAERGELLCSAVPDKKWGKVFKGSAVEYLRHRAVHFIKNYCDSAGGARLNQLANGLEEREKQFTELEAQIETLTLETPFDPRDCLANGQR